MAWSPWKPPRKTDPPAGLGVGRDGGAVNDGINPTVRLMSKDKALDGKLVVERRHVDWLEHQIRWRWLLDSYEGGDRYRNAVYGPDRKGLPCRNLFRHRREYPDPQQYPNVYQGFAGYMGMVNTQTQDVGYGPYPGMLGADPAATAQDDDYELRRAGRRCRNSSRRRSRSIWPKCMTRKSTARDRQSSRPGGPTSTGAGRRSTTGCARPWRRS